MYSRDRTRSLRQVIRSYDAFIALAGTLMALYGIPAFESAGLGLLGRGLTAILAILCVGIVIDQVQLLRGEDPLQT